MSISFYIFMLLLIAVTVLIFGTYFFLHPRAYFSLKKAALESYGLKGIRATPSFYFRVRVMAIIWIGLGVFLTVLAFQAFSDIRTSEQRQFFLQKFNEVLIIETNSNSKLLSNKSGFDLVLRLEDCYISQDLEGYVVGEDFVLTIPANSQIDIPQDFVASQQLQLENPLATVPLSYCRYVEMAISGDIFTADKIRVPF